MEELSEWSWMLDFNRDERWGVDLVVVKFGMNVEIMWMRAASERREHLH
jgi:hypothetical protein